ncbi:MAG: hypothetical protein ACI90G_001650, partial [Urechidicola sp.]
MTHQYSNISAAYAVQARGMRNVKYIAGDRRGGWLTLI